MKKMIRRLLSVAVCVTVILPLVVITTVSANSAQTIWSGVTSTGVIVEDEDCPLIVEKEVLTFNIPEFPENYYTSVEDFVQYQSSVSAEYTFYNPSAYTVTATLVFPFGNMPDYGMIVDYESDTWAHETQAHTQQYGVQVNGQPIKSTLRHTFSDPYGDFELSEDLPKLRSGYGQDPFFFPDMTVTRYIFKATDIYERDGFASFRVDADNAARRIIARDFNSYHSGENVLEFGCWTENKDTIIIDVIGAPFAEPLQWSLYEDGSKEVEICGSIQLANTLEFTLREYAMEEYDPASGASDTDWYNAFTDALKENYLMEYDGDLSYYLMRWYEYEITLAPGERIINAVTAPIYPGINGQYEPAKYDYTYLLSPAQTWASFGQLEIVINTPYYLLEGSSHSFEKTETGYTLMLEELPKGELEFTLSSDDALKKKSPDFLSVFMFGGIILLVIGAPIIAVALVVFLAVRVFRKYKNSREKT